MDSNDSEVFIAHFTGSKPFSGPSEASTEPKNERRFGPRHAYVVVPEVVRLGAIHLGVELTNDEAVSDIPGFAPQG